MMSFELNGKRVLVVGLARTGVATALFCSAQGAAVTAVDARPESDLSEAAAKLRAVAIAAQFEVREKFDVSAFDLVVPSPGVPADAPLLRSAQAAGIRIWSEIELAAHFLKGKLIGITGSNGKTTTTSLVEHILRTAGVPTILAGNIGTALIGCVERSTPQTITVAEISSFQLEWVDTFRPDVAVFLNLTPDHLDRHGNLETYGATKARIFACQTAHDTAVLNADDPGARIYAPQGPPTVYWFSRKQRVERGAFLADGKVVFRRDARDEEILRVTEIPIPGAHNVENVLAAVAAARLAGVSPQAIAAGVRTFAGVEHRIEFVAEHNGVRYYNDSKATNVDATLKALDSFPGRILIILGGKDKGSDYSSLREPLRQKAILALLIGSAADKIESQIQGSVAIERAGTLERAVEVAARAAHLGDIVLLAPACASFDQFQGFEHRGHVFKDLVRHLGKPAVNSAR